MLSLVNDRFDALLNRLHDLKVLPVGNDNFLQFGDHRLDDLMRPDVRFVLAVGVLHRTVGVVVLMRRLNWTRTGFECQVNGCHSRFNVNSGCLVVPLRVYQVGFYYNYV